MVATRQMRQRAEPEPEPAPEPAPEPGPGAAAGGPAPARRHYVDLPLSIGRLRVLRGFQVVSWVLALAWLPLVIHPDAGIAMNRKISRDENALSPANPIPLKLSQPDMAPYLDGAARRAVQGAGGGAWFGTQLEELGLAPTEHTFSCGESGPGRGAGATGTNIYAVLRAPHAKGAEAVVLAAPLPRDGQRLLGSAAALALARAAQQGPWMSKSLILLGFDAASCGGPALGAGAAAVEAWVAAYHSAGTDGLTRRGGLIREALVLDVDGSPQGEGEQVFETLTVLHEGYGAAMPNLDMMAAVVLQLQEVMPRKVLHTAAPPHADSVQAWLEVRTPPLFGPAHLCARVIRAEWMLQASEVGGVEAGCATDMVPDARSASGAANAGHERLPWWAGWRCLALALGRLAR